MNLNEKQLKFLKEELGFAKEEIEKMSVEEWKQVREQCFYIEADELMDLEDDETQESERCNIATSIANMKYSQLHNRTVA